MHSHLDSENSGSERDGEVVLMHGEEASPLFFHGVGMDGGFVDRGLPTTCADQMPVDDAAKTGDGGASRHN